MSVRTTKRMGEEERGERVVVDSVLRVEFACQGKWEPTVHLCLLVPNRSLLACLLSLCSWDMVRIWGYSGPGKHRTHWRPCLSSLGLLTRSLHAGELDPGTLRLRRRSRKLTLIIPTQLPARMKGTGCSGLRHSAVLIHGLRTAVRLSSRTRRSWRMITFASSPLSLSAFSPRRQHWLNDSISEDRERIFTVNRVLGITRFSQGEFNFEPLFSKCHVSCLIFFLVPSVLHRGDGWNWGRKAIFLLWYNRTFNQSHVKCLPDLGWFSAR